jgi:nitroimidazol reductase NimA-like FMN-containing flavoprotein (pyridoxamine 5'-phosphate oxidase superfamily)
VAFSSVVGTFIVALRLLDCVGWPDYITFRFTAPVYSRQHGKKGTRMSPRPNIELTTDEQAAFLLERHKCALATYGPDGFPHIVAMNFFVKNDAYCMTSYGKAQKVLNIRRNPKVALMIEAGDAYGELRGMMVRGICEIIEDPTRC